MFQLTVGFARQRNTRLLMIALIGVLGLSASGCLGFVLAMMFSWTVPGDATGGDWFTLGFVAAAPATAFAAYLAFTVAMVFRWAAWLDGTRLTVRGLRTRTIDLATARTVSLQPINRRLAPPMPVGVWSWQSGLVPSLVVTGPEGVVRLWLASRERILLPADQLARLGEVMAASRAAGAPEIARWLRDTAAASPPRG